MLQDIYGYLTFNFCVRLSHLSQAARSARSNWWRSGAACIYCWECVLDLMEEWKWCNAYASHSRNLCTSHDINVLILLCSFYTKRGPLAKAPWYPWYGFLHLHEIIPVTQELNDAATAAAVGDAWRLFSQLRPLVTAKKRRHCWWLLALLIWWWNTKWLTRIQFIIWCLLMMYSIKKGELTGDSVGRLIG